MKRFFSIFLVFGLLGLISPAGAKEPVQIRVAIARDCSNVSVSVSGRYDVVDAKSRVLLRQGRSLKAVKVSASPGGLLWKEQALKTGGILIQAKRPSTIQVNKRSYRGDIAIFQDNFGQLLVVNILDLEAYIQGVLAHEICPKWPMDAIKAQAVAARTYAVYQKEVMKKKDYDVTADTSSQMYGGLTAEKAKTNRAVRFTKGEVLFFEGKVFPAYFHATCGGMTEDASELWKIRIRPLAGGRACAFCAASPHYVWKVSIPLSEIAQKIQTKMSWRGALTKISVKERNPSGRVRTLSLTDDQGRVSDVAAKDFRIWLGPDIVRSTHFSVAVDGPNAQFSGRGWGHGAGLCQWGALGMAQEGYSYSDILAFYYPGARVVVLT